MSLSKLLEHITGENKPVFKVTDPNADCEAIYLSGHGTVRGSQGNWVYNNKGVDGVTRQLNGGPNEVVVRDGLRLYKMQVSDFEKLFRLTQQEAQLAANDGSVEHVEVNAESLVSDE